MIGCAYQVAGLLLIASSLLILLGFINKPTDIFDSGQASGVPVGGWGDWIYEYEPSFLPLPPEAVVEHAHGIVIDDNGQLVITYKDKADPSKCLLRWTQPSDYHKMPEFLGPGKSLCKGVPHGLNADFGEMVLYNANNEQSLHKTTMEGEILWTFNGKPDKNVTGAYRPTWFAGQPDSPYVHLADGYGSSRIYVFDKFNGTYTGYNFGGQGQGHGKFETCHAISWDWRVNQMVVTDRENHRLEYYQIDPNDPSVFDYSHTISFAPLLLQRPCNIRFRKDGTAIIPFLEGSVGILDENNNLTSVINITDALGDLGFLHPHDAHFMPDDSGDFVLVTWNPGRIGYFRRIKKGETASVSEQ